MISFSNWKLCSKIVTLTGATTIATTTSKTKAVKNSKVQLHRKGTIIFTINTDKIKLKARLESDVMLEPVKNT